MLLKQLGRYLKSIKINEDIEIKDLSILEILEMLSHTDNKEEILSRLDNNTLDIIKKMEEGGLI